MFDVPLLILSVLKLSLQEYTDVTAVQKDLDLIRDNAYSRCTAGTGGGSKAYITDPRTFAAFFLTDFIF